MIRILTGAAIVAAALLVLLGRVIPLPPLVTGEEGSRISLTNSREQALVERYKFQEATLDYQRYLASTAIPIIPNELRQEANELDAGGDRATLLAAARDRMQRILDLGHAMLPYAIAGDEFFATLQNYDNDLMSWSRTLGPRSENLRRSTWPILSWLERYPPPIGDNYELMFIPASSNSPLAQDATHYPLSAPAMATATALHLNPPTEAAPPPLSTTVGLLEQLAPKLNAPDASSATIREVAAAADGLWTAGKYIQPVDTFHDGYFSALRAYDAESAEVATTPETPLLGGTQVLAWSGAVVVGLVLLGGLLLIFAPPAFWRRMPLVRGRLASA